VQLNQAQQTQLMEDSQQDKQLVASNEEITDRNYADSLENEAKNAPVGNNDSSETSKSWLEISSQVVCISCQSKNLVSESSLKFTCYECGQDQAIAVPCCVEATSTERFAVNLNELHASCSLCHSDMTKLPCCSQYQPTIRAVQDQDFRS